MSKKTFTLMRAQQRDRRRLLRGAIAAAGAAALTGCDRLSRNETFVDVLASAEQASRAAQKILAPRSAMAQEFDASRIANIFFDDMLHAARRVVKGNRFNVRMATKKITALLQRHGMR